MVAVMVPDRNDVRRLVRPRAKYEHRGAGAIAPQSALAIHRHVLSGAF